MTVISFLKQNWMLIASALIVIIAFVMLFKNMTKEKYYDYEMAGCSTCSAGMAGVLVDTEDEMYQMPDDYYSEDAEDDLIDTNLEYAYEDEDIAADDDAVYDDDTFAGDDAENDLNLPGDVTFDDDDTYETGGNDAEDDIAMLDIDELDAEEEDYYVL